MLSCLKVGAMLSSDDAKRATLTCATKVRLDLRHKEQKKTRQKLEMHMMMTYYTTTTQNRKIAREVKTRKKPNSDSKIQAGKEIRKDLRRQS